MLPHLIQLLSQECLSIQPHFGRALFYKVKGFHGVKIGDYGGFMEERFVVDWQLL